MRGPQALVLSYAWEWWTEYLCRHLDHKPYQINDSVFILCLRCGKRSVKNGTWF